ncbi:PREDICTED: zinc finger and BTB domain-containing protein 25-like [Cyprinodon variegatus]|uniref:zinc finger and BTB domain-containing protein 25-like n=1 Tax=Cyprinodon variegatus TaxID=28743 RepID=UPI0007429246|nr:PREDICTED: zinc finger and BTB domain-containing protein 25-like [Cyprinodon variegatus]
MLSDGKLLSLCLLSECIKIQPTDIQPDVFSYLLHIMYTGMCPKQPVDQTRLQDGIKFLHAYQLCRKPGEGLPDGAPDMVRMSNLYGIQISSQLANKDTSGVSKTTTVSRGAPEDGLGAHSQLSLAVGLEGAPPDHQVSALRKICSGTSGDDSDMSSRIKQERVEEEDGDVEEGPGVGSLSPTQGSSPRQGPLFKDQPLVLQCPRCGERCSSPEDLREHLFSHALDPARLMDRLPQGGELESGVEEALVGAQEQLDAGCLEEALRQSQALATQLAAELRRSRGGEGGGSSPSPTILQSRKRKIACAVCSLRFSHKSQLQEHMYTHTGKPSRFHRYNRLCSQLFQGSAHFIEGAAEPGVGGGASTALSEDTNRDTQDNGSSCYSLDSEVSQESVDGVPIE